MMATSNSESKSSCKNMDNKENDTQNDHNTMFECNICLDIVNDPVVNVCGHLFCWPCLYKWLETTESCPVCPVCKADMNKDKVIPIYGRRNVKQEDPRNKVPPRPSGHGIELESTTDTPEYIEELYLSFRMGQFPFNFPSFSDNQNEAQFDAVLHPDSANFLSQLFVWVTVICLTWLCVA